jgi:hypothetical protein
MATVLTCPPGQISLYGKCWDAAVAAKFQATNPSSIPPIGVGVGPGIGISSVGISPIGAFQISPTGTSVPVSCSPGQRRLFVGTPGERCFELTAAQTEDLPKDPALVAQQVPSIPQVPVLKIALIGAGIFGILIGLKLLVK